MYLVDTNVISERTKKEPHPKVVAWLDAQREIAVCTVTLMELQYGISLRNSNRLNSWFSLFLDRVKEIPVTREVALLAGESLARAAKKGVTLSIQDMLIAATAMQSGRVLVTRNTRDFETCPVMIFNPFK